MDCPPAPRVRRSAAALTLALSLITIGACSSAAPAPSQPPTAPAITPAVTSVPTVAPPTAAPATIAATAEPTAGPTAEATPEVTPEPTPEPTPEATPDPLADWPELSSLFAALDLDASGAILHQDDAGDGLSPRGRPREIAQYMDIIHAYAGWIQLSDAALGPGGPFDCDDPAVLCGDADVALAGVPVILAAMQVDGPIELGADRDQEMTIAFDRAGRRNAPAEWDMPSTADSTRWLC